MSDALRYIALGGLGEVGMNCAVYDFGDSAFLLDCGVNFPDVDHFGVDVIVPDFSWVVDHVERIYGVVITHGHQDHIGALPHLLSLVDIPVYAPRYAMGLIEEALAEHDLLDDTELHEIRAGQTLVLGDFTLEFIHVNHSIPDALAVGIRCEVGQFVHSGDFKIDLQPFGEAPADLARFAALGDAGVRALFSDSTNIERPGTSGSERTVREGLERVIRKADGCVMITLFSSNVFRVQAAVDIAAELGRKIVLLGRSLQRNVQVARDRGCLQIPVSGLFVDPEDVGRSVARENVLVLCTGSQGQPRAALGRMAVGDFRVFSAEPGDTVVFSSRDIPGNERLIANMKDQLARRGVYVVDDAPDVHCSGHAYRDEQALLLSLVKPREFVPVHGDHRFLTRHAALARSLGAERTHVLDNGDVLAFGATDTWREPAIDVGRIAVDDGPLGTLTADMLRDRRALARRGVCIVWMAIDAARGEIVDGPTLINRGAIDEDSEGSGLIEEAVEAIVDAFEGLSRAARSNEAEVRDTARIAVRRFLRRELQRKPIVETIVYMV